MQVRMRGFASLRSRAWIAVQLIRLAAFVLGVKVQIDVDLVESESEL